MFFLEEKSMPLQWEKSSGKCDYVNKLRKMYSCRYVSKELWQTTRVQFLRRRVLFGKTWARLSLVCPVRCAQARNFVRPSANLSPYTAISVRRPLFNGYIIMSRNPANPLGSTWLYSARGILTIILYYL